MHYFYFLHLPLIEKML